MDLQSPSLISHPIVLKCPDCAMLASSPGHSQLSMLRCTLRGSALASSPGSPIFSTHAREKRGSLGSNVTCATLAPYTRVGRVADRENCAWASAIFELSGSMRVKKKATRTVSEGSTILRGLAEPCLIDQRRKTAMKSTLCGKASATPFCQHLSRDFRSQTLSRFFPASEKS